jgi:hypothetical protein
MFFKSKKPLNTVDQFQRERFEKGYWMLLINEQAKRSGFWSDLGGAAVALFLLWLGYSFLFEATPL